MCVSTHVCVCWTPALTALWCLGFGTWHLSTLEMTLTCWEKLTRDNRAGLHAFRATVQSQLSGVYTESQLHAYMQTRHLKKKKKKDQLNMFLLDFTLQEEVQQYEIFPIRWYNDCSLPAGRLWVKETMSYVCHCMWAWGYLTDEETSVSPCVVLTPWVGWGLQVWSQKTLWPPHTERYRLAAGWGPGGTQDSRKHYIVNSYYIVISHHLSYRTGLHVAHYKCPCF